ncbi:MAG: VanZ family protein [Clostridia bacterium]|nr:VanZ family protein [Clostridia bacterium]
MSAKRRRLLCLLWLAVIGTAAMIFAFSAQTGEDSAKTSGNVTAFLLRLFTRDFDSLPEAEQAALQERCGLLVRKGAHFTEFALLAFWVRLLLHFYRARNGFFRAWAAAALYAATDEAHQLLIAERAGQFQDILIDSAGALLGALLACALLGLRKKHDAGGEE